MKDVIVLLLDVALRVLDIMSALDLIGFFIN